MPSYTQGGFGSSIDTADISDGAVTLAKLASDSLVFVPIGAIIAWAKTFTNTPALPSNFVECAGQVLSDAASVYNGQTIPDLNSGSHRFLRGNTTSGTTGGTETHTHSVPRDGWGGTSGSTSGRLDTSGGAQVATNDNTSGSAGTLPSYYEVVWIIRIK